MAFNDPIYQVMARCDKLNTKFASVLPVVTNYDNICQV